MRVREEEMLFCKGLRSCVPGRRKRIDGNGLVLHVCTSLGGLFMHVGSHLCSPRL